MVNLDSVQQLVDEALASTDPIVVNKVASDIAELTHFETLGHSFNARSQATIRRHAELVVQLLHHQRDLLAKK